MRLINLFLRSRPWNREYFYREIFIEPFKIRANHITQSDHCEWFESVKLVKRRTIDIIFEEKIGMRLLLRKCQISKTNAYRVTWKSHLSNAFCQISLTVPYITKTHYCKQHGREYCYRLCERRIIYREYVTTTTTRYNCIFDYHRQRRREACSSIPQANHLARPTTIVLSDLQEYFCRDKIIQTNSDVVESLQPHIMHKLPENAQKTIKDNRSWCRCLFSSAMSNV